MSPTLNDDLEVQLRELFERQAAATFVGTRAWDDVPTASLTALPAEP